MMRREKQNDLSDGEAYKTCWDYHAPGGTTRSTIQLYRGERYVSKPATLHSDTGASWRPLQLH
jgi:hypothetical protein